MIKKIAAIAFVALLTNISVYAADESADSQTAVEKCESVSNSCMESCDSLAGDEKESCLEKCDSAYNKCMEEAQGK